MTLNPSRRGLLLSGGSLAAAPLVGPAGAQQPAPHQAAHPGGAPHADSGGPARPWRFFTADQAAMVSAMVDRLIPPDDTFTGAAGAGVPEFIDEQLAGAWGAGDRLYRKPPFAAGTPEQGYQLPFTPAALYRTALPLVARWVQDGYGSSFEDLEAGLQDAALQKLESGEAGFEEVPSAVFFETLLANTIEGYFSDPIHGGNRGMVGWRLVGFPGAYAGYLELVGRYNLDFDRPPRGIAQAVAEHAHGGAPPMRR